MMLVVENLTKKFKKTMAVDRLCMEIPRGEIYGFVGANGGENDDNAYYCRASCSHIRKGLYRRPEYFQRSPES